VKFVFIEAEKANFSIKAMCRVLEVSCSGFFAWRRRPPSTRTREDVKLSVEISAIYQRSRGTYGSPRIHAELRSRSLDVGRRRVARLMRERGLVARPPRRTKRTTESDDRLPIATNVLERRFDVDQPNRVWVTDITYVRTWQGWLYLAVVIDLFARRVVGWAMADHLRTELVLDALAMAIGRRMPDAGLVHHSDRGCQYASDAYRTVLERHGVVCSMSRKGNCWDNAVVESFFSTLKTELVHRHPWPTRAAAQAAIAEWIEVFYNRHRRHSSIGYVSPADYETIHQLAAQAA
jgi:putative transposase